MSPEEILQVEALIHGKVDLLRATNHYQEQLPFLRKNAYVDVKRVGILRTCFLVMDADGRSGVGFFKDRRVRRALNHAINRDHIVRGPFNNMAEAQKIIAREAFWVPIVKNRSISVMNRALDFRPSYDEIDRYFTACRQNP